MNMQNLIGTLTIGETLFYLFVVLLFWTAFVDISKLIMSFMWKVVSKILDFIADLIVKCIKSIIAKFRKSK